MRKNLTKSILLTLSIMLLFRVLSVIPTIGVNNELLTSSMDVWGAFNILSGGALSSASIMAVGVSAFITANIIMQMLAVVFERLSAMQHGGASDRRKYERLSTIVGVIFSIFESFATAAYLGGTGVLYSAGFWSVAAVGAQMFVGCLLTFWLAKLIDKYGFGEGISMILLTNILSSFPGAFISLRNMISRQLAVSATVAIFIAIGAFVVFFMSVYFIQGLHKDIPVSYSKRLSNSTLNKDKVLPIGFGLTGVMPIILSMSVLQLITMIAEFFPNSGILGVVAKFLTADNWFRPNAMIYSLGSLVVLALIIPCTMFYAKITLNTEMLAKNLQIQNGVINRVRPGSETEAFLNKQTKKMFLCAGVVTALIVLVPQFVANFLGAQNVFYLGTGAIITVSVIDGLITKFKAQNTQLAIAKVINVPEKKIPVFGE